jgi:hypothetical protein
MNYQIIKKEFKESLFESKGLWMIAVSSCDTERTLLSCIVYEGRICPCPE